MNNVSIMGRLTRDAELRQTQNGKFVCSFTIAVDREFKKDKTDFIDIVTWEKKAEFVSKYFHKGDMVAVKGSLQTDTYEDKNGVKRTSYSINADGIYFCGSKKSENPATPNVAFTDVIDDSDELPF